MSSELEEWFKEHGAMPFIQLLMHPDVTRVIVRALAEQDIDLEPVDLGPGELPTLYAVRAHSRPGPGEIVVRSVEDVLNPHVWVSPEELEELTGMYRHSVGDLPPDLQ